MIKFMVKGGENKMTSEEKPYTRETLAEYLDIAVITVDRWLKENKISSYKIGKNIRFDRSHVDEFLSRHERKYKKESMPKTADDSER